MILSLAFSSITVLTGSHHVNAAPGENFNEVNPGILLTWDGEPVDFTAGVYLNSYGKISPAAFASLPIVETEMFDVNVFGGVAYYPENGRDFAVSLGDIVPLFGVELQTGPLVIQAMPSDGVYTDAVITMGIRFDIP